MNRVLLLSGGLDSTCIAAWLRPEGCLEVDYGQKAARAEQRAATAVAGQLGLPIEHLRVNASAVGAGLMAGSSLGTSRAAEWWPFRNQLLITVAAAWAVTRDYDEVLVGTVAGDGSRHADGTALFYKVMAELLRLQEGGVSVRAPAIGLTAAELVRTSGVDDGTLGWTHSCHLADIPCGHCPGCSKRAEVLNSVGRLQ